MRILPGPFKLAKSSYVEDSPSYGCILLERCYARFDPRDDARNLLKQPELIRDGEYNIVLKGPIDHPNLVQPIARVIDTLE